jgi:YD repeat-containing protein
MAYKVVGADEDGHFPPRVEAALSATFVPKWKAATAYLAGDKVLSPSGDVVAAKVDFTSGASYSAANWDISPTYTPAFAPSTSIVYDATTGAVTSATENGVTTTYTYNADGSVNTETRLGKVRTWVYDASGNPTSSTVV